MWGVRVLREATHRCWNFSEWFILEVKGGVNEDGVAEAGT